MNRRGSAAAAALGLAAVLATGALAIAGALRQRERRSFSALSTAAARAAIFARAVGEANVLPATAQTAERTFTEVAAGRTFRVSVVWKKSGDRWRAVVWNEEAG